MATPDKLAAAFENSITWEEDIWQADPLDVLSVHKNARAKFWKLLKEVAAGNAASQPRILLFHGQSGSGKTHLIRALRTDAHRKCMAYFCYAQMTPDISIYADYFLRRLINSLEKPYNPDGYDAGSTENGLVRISRLMVDALLSKEKISKLRESNLDEEELAILVLNLADDIVSSQNFADKELDINIIRALLYLQRHDPRLDQRIRQYLFGRELNELSISSVRALDANTGNGHAFEIIEALGIIISAVDDAALVFSIDQVEDLRNFEDAEDRFIKAIGDLMQIASRIPNAIILVAVSEEFYTQSRAALQQSYIDRIEKAGPVALHDSPTEAEARQIISKRLEFEAAKRDDPQISTYANNVFGSAFFKEFAGLSTRRLLEHAHFYLDTNHLSSSSETQKNLQAIENKAAVFEVNTNQLRPKYNLDNIYMPEEETEFISKLAAAIDLATENDEQQQFKIDYYDIWERFCSTFEADIPDVDHDLLNILSIAINLAIAEWQTELSVVVKTLNIADDLPAMDIQVKHPSGHIYRTRVYLCNRPTQGGAFKRQLDKVLCTMDEQKCYMLRAFDFPPGRKNQTAQAYRKFRDAGGRPILVPSPEWARIMMIHEFHTYHRDDPGFYEWFAKEKMLSGMALVIHVLRLDLLGQTMPCNNKDQVLSFALDAERLGETTENANKQLISQTPNSQSLMPGMMPGENTATSSGTPWADWLGWGNASSLNSPPADNDDEIPISILLNENDDNVNSIFVGRELHANKPVTLNKGVMKRHSAVLGGSGSGKTTLALSLIEQFLANGIPAVLIDRKGDLCSYANPDVWRGDMDEPPERTLERERLGEAIDVAVYTPGRASGRPISITLLPNGVGELPSYEQQLLANLSAVALGDMLHMKKSAMHQKQSGTLSVALRILGSRSSNEVSLSDLIAFLEDEDAELADSTQRMDPSGKIRRDLVAQLDSLRYRNAALFDTCGESLHMDSLLGLGDYAKPGRTRLSVIYTGFLGDNENILFWVSQFLSEALRFCQRNPNDELQAIVMFDEADLYIPANSKPATAEPLQSLLKRARSAGLGLMLATQSPGDLDYKSRDQITSWFIGRVREDTALRKLKAAFQTESGLDPTSVLPHQTVGQFHLVQEGLVRSMRVQRSLILAEQVPFDRIEQLARDTRGQDQQQLKLFDLQ
ncbi:MAG: DUF853 family protein [Hyphomicrobiaceae bacterium]|nr:DUF853 family protein [Hyphomicrobiaceae bacterium]